MKCRLLFNDEPIVINRLSAKVLGLSEAIVVQQIHYWLNINEKAKKNLHDGRYWTFNTHEDWQKETFDFWSLSTVKRIFKSLEKKGILIKGNYNYNKYDHTMWVTLDYEKLDEILVAYELENHTNVEIPTKVQNDTISDCNKVSKWNSPKVQNDTVVEVNLTPSNTEINTENTKEISFTTQFDTKVSVVDKEIQSIDTNKELIENNTHLLLDSKNKECKVSKWHKDRLIKAIEIFKGEGGQYFSLLEKIYKDDKNFAPKATNRSKLKGGIGYCSMIIGDKEMFQYEEDEFNRMVEEKQKYR